MTSLLLAAAKAPKIDWAGFSPILALFAGSIVVILVGLLRSRIARERLVPGLTIVAFAASAGLAIWQWDESGSLFSGALALDPLALVGTIGVAVCGIAAVLLAYGASAPREAAHGEYHALLLVSGAGMAMFCGAQNLITTFLALELLSVPLYVLAATELHRRRSLEAGLKYLVVGSVGSATLLYGFALIFGAAGHTDYAHIAGAIGAKDFGSDGLLLAGVLLSIIGLGFKASVAPFHQWTPDVYEGAPTPVTAFMATATKIAALIAMLRLFDVALVGASGTWQPVLAALAATAMIVGNAGALGQSSTKRLLAFSSVGQAGYMLVGVVVGTRLGAQATVFYILAYAVMTTAAFAVVAAVEREAGHDRATAFAGLARRRPVYGVVLTAALLGLAGIPGTVGFVAKLRLVQSAVDGNYAWLAIVLVVGSMISLGYYLRLVARLWEPLADADPDTVPAGARAVLTPRTRADLPPLAGGSPEADGPSRDGGADDGGDDRVERAGSDSPPPVRGAGQGDVLRVPPALAESGEPLAAISTERGADEPVIIGRAPLPTAIVAAVAGAAVVVLGVVPGPLMDQVEAVVRGLPGLF